jgi:hypothetical protein
VPSLDLRFADNKSLADAVTGASLVTFTRASSGTFVDSAGTLQTAATDVPRFDHNPVTGESLGLLVEEARTNLVLRSEELDNAVWTKVGGTISANSIASPNGAITADTLIEDTSTGTHRCVNSATIANATIYTVSAYAKAAGGRTHVRLSLGSGLAGELTANLSNGTVAASSGATNPTVQLVGNGWYRISFTSAASSSTTGQVQLQLIQGTNTPSYTGDGASGAYFWGAQLEAGAFPTSYIPTTGATATRSADVASITGSAFSSFYRADEGTMFADVTVLSTAKTNHVISIDDGTTNNRIELRVVGSATIIQHNMTAGGVAQNNGSITVGSDPRRVAALSYRSGDTRLQSGVIGTTFTGTTVPTVTQIQLNKATFANGEINGTIRRFTFWPQRLANTTLQPITTL